MTITGLQSLRAKLTKKIPAQAKSRARQALAQNADELVELQKRLAPVASGKLRDSITATFGGGQTPKYAAFRGRKQGKSRNSKIVSDVDPDMSVVVTAGNGAVRYAHLVEFGTSPHKIKAKNAAALTLQGGAVVEEVGHPGAQARPFFYPAYRTLRKRMKGRVTRAIRKGIKEGSG